MKRDLLLQAYGAMRHDLRKTLLTMLGMAWGIATVVLLLAYGDGFGRAIQAIWDNYGATVIQIYPGLTSQQVGGSKAGVAVRFTQDDVELIRNVAPLVRRISRNSGIDAKVQAGVRSFTFPVNGIDPAVFLTMLKVESGRFINDEDNVMHNHVAVLSFDAKQKLFSEMSPLDERIRINGVSFQVVGVLAPRMQEQQGNRNINDTVFIPFTAMESLKDIHYLDNIMLDAKGLDHTKIAQTIRGALAMAHKFNPGDEQAVYIADIQQSEAQFGIVIAALKVLLGFIGTLTLGIGGVGLMNIMLVSVTQRTREIGVQKALGARKRDILLQFLAEALVITAVGGMVGIFLSYVISFSVGSITFYSALAQHASAADIRLVVSVKILVIATAILGVVGIISGMLPAVRAANLDPIEALRYE